MTSDADSRVILANAIDHLADSIDHLAVTSQALSISPGGAQAPTVPASPPAPPSGPPVAPPGAPSNGDDTKTKMGKKVFAICKQNNWDIADIGQRATGRDLGGDSRQWSQSDLAAVLDALKDWGFG